MTERKKRGLLTNVPDDLKVRYEKTVHLSLDATALRLMPYTLYRAMDQMPIDRSKVNHEEIEILKLWTKAGLCVCYPSSVPVRFPDMDFYLLLVELVYAGYILV